MSLVSVRCPNCGRALRAVDDGRIAARLCRNRECGKIWTVAVKPKEIVYRHAGRPPDMHVTHRREP